jgi:hypothetical protein
VKVTPLRKCPRRVNHSATTFFHLFILFLFYFIYSHLSQSHSVWQSATLQKLRRPHQHLKQRPQRQLQHRARDRVPAQRRQRQTRGSGPLRASVRPAAPLPLWLASALKNNMIIITSNDKRDLHVIEKRHLHVV